jgi:hypothetical protein
MGSGQVDDRDSCVGNRAAAEVQATKADGGSRG